MLFAMTALRDPSGRLAQSELTTHFSDLGGALLVCVVGLQPLVWCTFSLTLVNPESFDLR